MTRGEEWRRVDEGWGREAVAFATLSEPANCREYVALHQHLGVGPGDRLLDIACGSGLAVELERSRPPTAARACRRPGRRRPGSGPGRLRSAERTRRCRRRPRHALATEAGDDVAASVLRGDDHALDPAERAMARWARAIAREPNATTAADVDEPRDAGFDDAQIFAITSFVSFRLAFSIVNDALGARPDHQLVETVPAAVRDTVTWGRPVAPPPPG